MVLRQPLGLLIVAFAFWLIVPGCGSSEDSEPAQSALQQRSSDPAHELELAVAVVDTNSLTNLQFELVLTPGIHFPEVSLAVVPGEGVALVSGDSLWTGAVTSETRLLYTFAIPDDGYYQAGFLGQATDELGDTRAIGIDLPLDMGTPSMPPLYGEVAGNALGDSLLIFEEPPPISKDQE